MFAPYTPISTNILFFDRSGPTKEVWYYEHPLPEGRKNYTKTRAIQFDEFVPCLEWLGRKEENEQAWKISATDIARSGYNLDRKNPRAQQDITQLPPNLLAESILHKENRIAEIIMNITDKLNKDRN